MVNLNWQPGMTLDSIEKEAIQQAFAFYQKNKSATSRALGIAVRTLETKLEKYEADDGNAEQRDIERRAASDAFLQRQRFGNVAGVATPTGPAPAARPPAGQGVEAQHGHVTNAGVHVEPAQEAPAKQPVPVPVRKEVQDVPSKQTAGSGKHQRR